MKDAVKIGLVGAGAIAQLAHLPVLTKMRGASVTAICDNDRPKARALADRFGIEDVLPDIEDLLELEELDAVVIATPNHLHEPHVQRASRRSDTSWSSVRSRLGFEGRRTHSHRCRAR